MQLMLCFSNKTKFDIANTQLAICCKTHGFPWKPGKISFKTFKMFKKAKNKNSFHFAFS